MIDSVFHPQVDAAFEAARATRPFPSPEDWRDHPMYFLLVDRFAHPTDPPAHPYDAQVGTFQGGSFAGVRDHLDYLVDLGTRAIWLSPVLKNCQYDPGSYHGYGIQDFLTAEPRFAADPAAARADHDIADRELRELVDDIHAHGMYVIFDIVLNHSGDVFAYRLPDGSVVPKADWSSQPYEIHWRDERGDPRREWTEAPASPAPDAAVWPSELRHNERYRRQGKGGEGGGDFESLKELVTDFTHHGGLRPLRPVEHALIRAYQYAIARFDVDGFRIDTLKFIEPAFAQKFGNAIREFALSIGKKNFFTFGEIWDSEEKIARFIGRQAVDTSDLIGVDAALDFPLFHALTDTLKGAGNGSPAVLANVFEHRKRVSRGHISSHGEAGRYFVTFLDNHDQWHRFFFSPPDDPHRYVDQVTSAVTLLYTLQGIPCLYYGTEQGLHGSGGIDWAVREALWGKPHPFDKSHPFYQTIAQLSRLRAAQPSLRYGRQYFRPTSTDATTFAVSNQRGGVIAYSRLLNEQELLIVANPDDVPWSGEVLVDFDLNPAGTPATRVFASGGSPKAPSQVNVKEAGSVRIEHLDGSVAVGPMSAVGVEIEPYQTQVIVLNM